MTLSPGATGPRPSTVHVPQVTVRKWDQCTLLAQRGPTAIKVKAHSITARAKGSLITLNSFKHANSIHYPLTYCKNTPTSGEEEFKGQEEGGTVHQPSPPRILQAQTSPLIWKKKEELTVDPNLVATVRGADTERCGEGSLSAQPGSVGTVRGAVEVAEEKRMVQAETGCAAALQKHTEHIRAGGRE